MLPTIDEDRTQVTKRPSSDGATGPSLSTARVNESEWNRDRPGKESSTDPDLEVDSNVETDVLKKVRILPRDPYPVPGDRFQGFEIQSELGRGSMGRVFLALQPAMASRTVVLKVGQRLSSECQKLAKLVHPNIVPVHSFHQEGQWQCVCMPYRGSITLGHLADQLKSQNLETISGKALTTVISVCRENRKELFKDQPGTAIPATAVQAAPRPNPEPSPVSPLLTLRKLNYIDSILMLIREVVEGLRFAHTARIVHSDLKPANILISDDGVPQLIDFGIAYDKSNINSELLIGGTRPYMSPEQLSSFLNEKRDYDERSDLYSIGVILYELLTGRLPFSSSNDSSVEAITADYQKRLAPPASPRSLNGNIPFAVESIIAKCLDADRSRRYHSAAQLIDDINCQIERRPLIYAENPSRNELVAKWMSRHRHAIVVLTVMVIFGGSLMLMFQSNQRRREQIARLNVNAAGELFQSTSQEAEFLFGLSANDTEYRDRARIAGHRALDQFGAWDEPDWFQKKEYRNLPEDKLASYRMQCASLMLLYANSLGEQSSRATDAAEKEQLLKQAYSWNERAELTHPVPSGCRAVWIQRSYFTRLRGDYAEAERLYRRAEPMARGFADTILEGRQLLTEGRSQAALALFKESSQLDPRNFWSKFYGGVSLQKLGQDDEAIREYDACESIQPGFFGTHFNRGQSRLRLGRLADSEKDFNRAIELRPNWSEAYFQRALSRERQKRFPEAIEDLDQALELGFTPTSVYLMRARVWAQVKDFKAYDVDMTKALKTVPTDERGWLARAQARISKEPEGALADYEEALKLNPKLTVALQGKAHLLGNANRNAESAKALTQLISINPDSPDAWSGRGVLRARMNDRDGAVADAREALRITERAAIKYQVAGIYALTSKIHPEDRREAFQLLESALRDGFGFEYLKDDPELEPIRKDPEFTKVIEAAKAYRNSLKKTN